VAAGVAGYTHARCHSRGPARLLTGPLE